jgi:hypothetical protein
MVIRPAALSPERQYRLRNLDLSKAEETEPRTGAAWMSEGLSPIREQSFIGLLEAVLE